MVKGLRKGVVAPLYLLSIVFIVLLSACSIQKAQKTLLQTTALKGAHVGIAVYNDTKQAWIDQYQSDHYFTPASNTKILATYVGLKYLGDSLPGFSMAENADTLFLTPLGDPSFLHPDFTYQPVVDLIRQTTKQIVITATKNTDHFEAFGDGWAWNDYNEDYQPERSRMPIYGNLVHFNQEAGKVAVRPNYFFKHIVDLNAASGKNWTRKKVGNVFYTTNQKNTETYFQVPFSQYFEPILPIQLLKDTLKKQIHYAYGIHRMVGNEKIIKTVPTDSLLKIMMSRSDNFFADQILLMASEQFLGNMDDAAFIDTVIKTEFIDLPQPMRWADGSGLSRYNLNTPENYIAILKQMQAKYGESRVRNIFEKGGEGTLSAYYKNFPGSIYAKTGTLGGQIALSGFIYTQHDQKLYFSVLVANHMSKTTSAVRKAVEAYLVKLASKN